MMRDKAVLPAEIRVGRDFYRRCFCLLERMSKNFLPWMDYRSQSPLLHSNSDNKTIGTMIGTPDSTRQHWPYHSHENQHFPYSE